MPTAIPNLIQLDGIGLIVALQMITKAQPVVSMQAAFLQATVQARVCWFEHCCDFSGTITKSSFFGSTISYFIQTTGRCQTFSTRSKFQYLCTINRWNTSYLSTGTEFGNNRKFASITECVSGNKCEKWRRPKSNFGSTTKYRLPLQYGMWDAVGKRLQRVRENN